MPQGIEVRDANGNLVLDTNDRFMGGVTEFLTGKTSGSHTVTPPAGQSVEFVYRMPEVWIPSGTGSRWPGIVVNGNTITWAFNSSVPQADRNEVLINVVLY